ncbi:isopropylmalate/homocitrate/citramalatesynthase [Leptospira ryugenii]|uniref:2-isopropylmalate synthase n=1 Tax=Leptospira ryugenii TaxID=1917863 RepID=A0A2P2DV81_9LEPT|nr:2-isopropylmalate synthase LeuA2 [Leptospira ryugenii]GBF48558.1 isopropylmalate/homocitrate/citramalatesynthase [Leptospira ryugenii]
MKTKNPNQVWIQDVTLRDGNQALKKPWTFAEKEQVFAALVALQVDGVELGFPSSNELEFRAVAQLAKQAPPEMTVSALSRAKVDEIERTWEAIQFAKNPRLHIVYPVSHFQIHNVLRISEEQVLETIHQSISFARSLAGEGKSIQFSGEHFGDAIENFNFTIEAFQTAIRAGADVINLPNTVERYRPFLFVDMVKRVKEKMPDHITLSVHTHNDLGMATATTVESVFVGANQVEVALNGLGERAGNTNLYETALALHQCGVRSRLNFQKIYPTALLISELSGIPIGEKTPIIGEDIFSHRSGIHQDGVTKTIGQEKGAYRTFRPEFVGRGDAERIDFTNQSGTKAIVHVLQKSGISLDAEKIKIVFQKAKELSGSKGNRSLSAEEILQLASRLFPEENQIPDRIQRSIRKNLESFLTK